MSLTGLAQRLVRPLIPKRFYCEDALVTSHNHSFVDDATFLSAYQRGLQATGGYDYHNRWRVHIALWVARCCAHIEGDFIECGVNYGLNSSAMMHMLGWDELGKTFWLVDSWSGVDEAQLTAGEKASGALARNAASKQTGFYNCDVERARKNFAEWKNARVIQGWIPQCLKEITADKVAFMHIDLNSVVPEIQAFKYFLTKLTPGAFVLLDDYAYSGGDTLFAEWTKAGRELGIDILSLPTGQGLIQIPAR